MIITYATERAKSLLIRDTLNYVCNHMDVKLSESDPTATREYFGSADFSRFRAAIARARSVFLSSDDIRETEDVRTALRSWNFGLQFAIPPGQEKTYKASRLRLAATLPGVDLSNRVRLLRDIIVMIDTHGDDAWTKEDDQGPGRSAYKLCHRPMRSLVGRGERMRGLLAELHRVCI